jgi:hypothetical protein
MKTPNPTQPTNTQSTPDAKSTAASTATVSAPATEKLEALLQKTWSTEEVRFNYPNIKDPVLGESAAGTAQFDFGTKELVVDPRFAAPAVDALGEPGLAAILRHELGHYTGFPQDLATAIYLNAMCEARFKGRTSLMVNLYADAVNEIMLLKSGLGDLEVIKLREYMEDDLRKRGDPFFARIQFHLHALYKGIFKMEEPVLVPEDAQHQQDLRAIPYLAKDRRSHYANCYLFGSIMEKMMPPESEDAQSGGGEGDGESGDGESGDGHSHGKGFSCSHNKNGGPIKNATQEELDNALNEILRKDGPDAFEKAKKYLKEKHGFKDSFGESESSTKQAGYGSGSLTWMDDMIPFYRRWASTFGVFITKRPIIKDLSSPVRMGVKEYEVGDPIHKLDPFGSYGYVCIPGISKVFEEEPEPSADPEWHVPDVIIGIDTSGSMPSAKGHGISQLAAYIMMTNYRRNGSRVGAWNFSTDMIFVNPTWDLDEVERVLLAYWGGGTVVNTEKLEKLLSKIEPDKKGIYNTENITEHPELMGEHMKEFMDKSLTLSAPKAREKVKRLDNILITDGYIGNAEETLKHLTAMGEITRNFIFITDNGGYDHWASLSLPNTYVYKAVGKDDLLRLALGRAKTVGK